MEIESAGTQSTMMNGVDPLRLALGLAVIAAAVYAVLRKVDVRLALLSAAAVLGLLAGNLPAIVQRFLVTLADEKFVVPICTAMGFAYVLRHTGCDQHLVQLLVKPLRRARPLLVPGAVLVGFLVNIPIISQTSTAVAIGSVLIPLLFAARLSPVTAGAALLLGASIGGELLNPGAPEYSTIVKAMEGLTAAPVTRDTLVRNTLPLNLLHLFVATAVFWLLSARAERKRPREDADEDPLVTPPSAETPPFAVSPLKAVVPLVPLALLFLTSNAFQILSLPQSWLVSARESADPQVAAALFDSRLIGAAMLVGVVVAALSGLTTPEGRKTAGETARVFFEGAGFAFAEIIAIIVAASCFAEGVKGIGVGDVIGGLVQAAPALLLPAATLLPLLFAAISGSGMAATQGLFEFFVAPAAAQGADPAWVGSLVALGAAAGRTMSPVAAVTLMSAKLTGTNPADLVKRVAVPLFAGMAAVLLLATVTAPRTPPPAPPGSAAFSERLDNRP